MTIGKAMFWDRELSDYLRHSLSRIPAFVENRYQGPREDVTDEQFAKGIAAELKVVPLDVDFDNPVKDVKSARIRVRDFGREIETDGVRATISFPFSGIGDLFWLKPNSYSTVLPHGEVSGGRVTVGFHGPNVPETVKAEVERQISLLRQYLDNQRHQIEAHNQSLWQQVLPYIQQRKLALEGLDQLKSIF